MVSSMTPTLLKSILSKPFSKKEDDEDGEKETESDVSHVELSLIEHCDVLDERKSIKV